jgi:single-strand DNA-binding protein
MASRSWNRVELIGNLTRDPEMRYTPSGAAVVTFTIATNRTFVSDGEKREEADFHRCVAWNKLAELCNQLLKKGNRVFVAGRLQNRSLETPEGQTRYITEIVIEDMILLTSRNNGELGEATQDEPAVASRNADEMPNARKSEVGSSPGGEASEKLEEKKEAKKEEQKEKPEKPKVEKEEIEDLDDLPF